MHILFGAIFIVGGALHLYFNWKPFISYLAERVSGQVTLKRESLAWLLATSLLIIAAVYAIPPVSWLFDLNDTVKSYWGRAPGHEPPYPRAEQTPLPVLAKRLGLDHDAALAALKTAGLRVAGDRGASRGDPQGHRGAPRHPTDRDRQGPAGPRLERARAAVTRAQQAAADDTLKVNRFVLVEAEQVPADQALAGPGPYSTVRTLFLGSRKTTGRPKAAAAACCSALTLSAGQPWTSGITSSTQF